MKDLFKRVALAALLSCCLLFSTACQSLAGNSLPRKLDVVTSLPLVKDIAGEIGGDKIRVMSIVKGIHCDHEYEPSPKDMTTLAKCTIFIKIGMGSDTWTDKLAAGVGNRKMYFIDASRGVKKMTVHGSTNPHYWGDPDNVKVMAANILKGFIMAAPDQKRYFTNNYQRYIQKIDRTAAALRAEVASLPDKKIISYSGAFPYFFKAFGFENMETVEVSCEQEVSPKDLTDAANLIKKDHLKILIGDAAEPKEPLGLARETKTQVVLLWATTDPSGDYLTTLTRNVKKLVKALK